MHSTHQFFSFPEKCLYSCAGGRKDENPGYDINRPFLQEKYDGIKGFYKISCKTGKGIKQFRSVLYREIAKIEFSMWAESWFNVKNIIANMKEPFIFYDVYKSICAGGGIAEKEQQDTLAEFLNDLGINVNFKDFELNDTHILELNWITNAVYKIITLQYQ